MFVYLANKVAIKAGHLESVAWSEDGWLVAGGSNGVAKIMKLESSRARKNKGVSSKKTSMEQNLGGHSGIVKLAVWNQVYDKLTTSDSNALIIVWYQKADAKKPDEKEAKWEEEMVNVRDKSTVADMRWTSDGKKICIAYADGAVIVGTVEGARMWAKNLDTELTHVEWSPDHRSLLFASPGAGVHHYDADGNHVAELSLYAITPSSERRIVGLEWFRGRRQTKTVPSLAIVFDNGTAQIMKSLQDEQPVLIDTGMQPATAVKWNANGSVLAIAGSKDDKGVKRHQVQFYSPFGKFLRSLKVASSSQVRSLAWDGDGLRLAMAVDSHVYLANIRPEYEWAYFSNTLVYSFVKTDRSDDSIAFWDTESDECHFKSMPRLQAIRAAADHCVIAAQSEEKGKYLLVLSNSIGTAVDSKLMEVEPIFLCMSSSHVIAANEETVYVWQYRTIQDPSAPLAPRHRRGQEAKDQPQEYSFHIDHAPQQAAAEEEGKESKEKEVKKTKESGAPDPISCITCSTSDLIVARASGTLLRFSLPELVLKHQYEVKCLPYKVALNCDSTTLSIIDINGVLTLLSLDARPDGPKGPVGHIPAFERKDVWDMKWSNELPQLLACMEAGRMYVFRGTNPEEPTACVGYLCDFSDLCIKAALLDDIMADPSHPKKELVLNMETKSLRDSRQLLATVPINEAFTFIEDNPHARLWRLLAEAALEQLNFVVADKAFVRCADYQGIQFVKRIAVLNDAKKQQAEVAAYFGRYDEAERLFLEMDCPELAIELRTRLGDWFRVTTLLESKIYNDKKEDSKREDSVTRKLMPSSPIPGKEGSSVLSEDQDQMLLTAWNHLGDHYADRQDWRKAREYYEKSGNSRALIRCAYRLDDYRTLTALIDQIPKHDDALIDLGEKFMSVGLCNEAVSAYLKAGDAKAAINCCVHLHFWDKAVRLAEEYKFPEIDTLLTKYATYLLSKNNVYQAVDVYRKANKHTEASKLLWDLGQKSGSSRSNPQPLRAKKLHILAALEKQKVDSKDGKEVGKIWHGAEAYYFWMLAHKQLYSEGVVQASQLRTAMRTALRLADYDDILDPKDVFSLIALLTFYNKFLEQCSRALTKLETLDSLTSAEREKYQQLALSIFTTQAPTDLPSEDIPCPNSKCNAKVKEWSAGCATCNTRFSPCLLSARPLVEQLTEPDPKIWTCSVCHHHILRSELTKTPRTFCPLCHFSAISS